MSDASLKDTVLIKRCEEYDRDLIERLVSEGMRELDYKPSGKVFAKPNTVVAFKPELFGANAYTNKDVVGATLLALSKADGIERVDLGENCAVGMPTRLIYKHSGYFKMIKELKKQASCPLGIFAIDEERRDEVFIGGRVHDTLRVARKMARADSKVYLPKLKCHCVSNMTGTVKLNVGICSDDERSIRHDFMLNEKIVDLLSAGYPDFTVMDAIDVGVGNEAYPDMRKLGLILMGRNPVAVDLVATRLLGFGLDDIPYLKLATERGYSPTRLEDVPLAGDLTSIADLDEQAKRLMPYDDAYYRWQDVNKELDRLNSPLRFYWGPYRHGNGEKCLTGCVMGIKMFLASYEQYAGAEAFLTAKPSVMVIGRYDEQIDARGADVYLLGSCASADIVNAKKITHLDNCFVTASDMSLSFGHKLGMPAPTLNASFMLSYASSLLRSMVRKTTSLRYLQDTWYFLSKGLVRRV